MTDIDDRQATLDRLCSDYLDQKMYAQKATDEADAIKAQILNMDPENRELRGVAITKPSARFNIEQAKTVMSAEQLAACTVPALSGAEAKKILAPAIYQACCRASGLPGLRAI